MKRILIAAAASLALGAIQPAAQAADAKAAQDELKEHGCLACHEQDKKKVGPALKDISAKYSGKKVDDAIAGMKSKPVHKGALAKTQDSSLKTILEWVLTLK